MDKSTNEHFSRDPQHHEVPYYLAKGKEKHDKKVSEMYGFEDTISFALVAGSGDLLCI